MATAIVGSLNDMKEPIYLNFSLARLYAVCNIPSGEMGLSAASQLSGAIKLGGILMGANQRTISKARIEPDFDDVPRIVRRTLHSEVLNQLRDMIIEGRLAPGARINEGQIGTILGVSRTPLREAIKSLTSEGLVEIVPAKGAVVRRFTEDDLIQILQVLKVIEQLGVRLTCANASDKTIAHIKFTHDRMIKLYKAGNRLEYFKLNQAIHTSFVKASGNIFLAEMHETLQARIKRPRYLGNGEPSKWAGAVAEHEEMIDALIKRDGERLAEVVARHLDATVLRVRNIL